MRLGRARQREDAGDEGAAPKPAEDDRAEEREADGDEQLTAEARGQGEGLVGRLFDDDDPGRALHLGGDGQHAPARLVHVFVTDTRQRAAVFDQPCREVQLRCSRLPWGVRRGNVLLLVRVAVGDQPNLLGDDEREALLADVDAIDVVPHLQKIDLADYPPSLAARGHDTDGNRGPRQSVLVDLHRRDVGAIGADA